MLNVWRFESMGQFITVEAHPENRYGKIIAASDQYKELIGTWVIKPGVNSKWENLASTIGPGTIKYYCNGGKKNDP